MNPTLDRRQFLTATTKTLAGAAATRWTSAAAAPEVVVDTHTHFYDPSRTGGVPWPPPEDKLLYRTVLPKNYRALPVPRPVTGTVVVEASPWVEDNQWILDLAAKDLFIVGFVGNLPVGTKDFPALLKRFAANNLFRGIRIRDQKLEANNGGVMADLKRLADSDLSVDLVNGGDLLQFADELAQSIPSLRIIIDHLAGVAVDGKAPPGLWVNQMRKLARRPKVFCKLSGLVEGTGRTDGSAPRDVEFYRPVLNTMRELFGPDRLIYASNWPVSERFAPLTTVQSIVSDYFRSVGQGAEEQVLSKSGQQAYRWVVRDR